MKEVHGDYTNLFFKKDVHGENILGRRSNAKTVSHIHDDERQIFCHLLEEKCDIITIENENELSWRYVNIGSDDCLLIQYWP